MDWSLFEERKRDHLRHALDSRHEARDLSGLGGIRLVHEALPDLDFSEIELTTPCLGHQLATPFYVAGMTAGHADAPELNRRLAHACARRGWAMGVGSQRREFEVEFGSASSEIDRWACLRAEVPDLVLIANLGASQLLGAEPGRVIALASALEAQAIAIHLNALQEAIQPEGTPRFRGVFSALARLCEISPVPVLVKETGCGISASTLKRLAGLAIAGVDVSGLGGTHWGRIEGARAAVGSIRALAAETFADWGVPTAISVKDARRELPGTMEIWASGGVRSGLDAAKLIALGAHRVGYARPALEAALEGEGALDSWMERQEFELRVALFVTGCQSPEQLGKKDHLWTPITS